MADVAQRRRQNTLIVTKEVITNLDQVTPEWLTSVLTRSGALDKGAVEDFDVDTRERELSTNAKLKLRFSDGSRGDMPKRLFLKMVDIDMEDEFFGPAEVNYYTRDYVELNGAPIVRCYDAAFSEEKQRYHVMMDDLSETHVAGLIGINDNVPTLEYGFALAENLATMHAHLWGKECLKEIGETIPSAEVIKRFVNVAKPGVRHILNYCTDQLKSHWPEEMLDLYDKHPRAMMERTQDINGFTLIHGDANPGNILIPIDEYRPLYIVDQQPFDWSLTTWLGVYDLSYAIVHWWEPEIRRKLEKQILRHYHEHLLSHGVQEYSWDQLYEDYRLCAVMSVYVATEWCRGGVRDKWIPVWLPMLQKSMTAFDDLECNKLW